MNSERKHDDNNELSLATTTQQHVTFADGTNGVAHGVASLKQFQARFRQTLFESSDKVLLKIYIIKLIIFKNLQLREN